MKRIFAALFVFALAPGCGGPGSGPSAPTIFVYPSAGAVAAGQSRSFSVPGGHRVTWSLSGTTCAGVSCGALVNTTPNSTDYVAPTTIPSAMRVTLRATDESSDYGMAAITAYRPGAIAIQVSPATAAMTDDESIRLVATVENDPLGEDVAWHVSGGCFGECGSVWPATTPSGVAATFRPTSMIFAGKEVVTITATSFDPTVSGAAKVTVSCAGRCYP